MTAQHNGVPVERLLQQIATLTAERDGLRAALGAIQECCEVAANLSASPEPPCVATPHAGEGRAAGLLADIQALLDGLDLSPRAEHVLIYDRLKVSEPWRAAPIGDLERIKSELGQILLERHGGAGEEPPHA